MGYCTTIDIRDVLSGTLGGIPGAPDELTDSQLMQAITDAQTEIDLSLSRLYVTPLNPVPEPIRQISINISCYLADLTYRMSKPYGAGNNSPLQLRYARARMLLNGIVSGTYNLALDDTFILTSDGIVLNYYDGDLITTDQLFGPAIHGSLSTPEGFIFSVDDITRVETP